MKDYQPGQEFITIRLRVLRQASELAGRLYLAISAKRKWEDMTGMKNRKPQKDPGRINEVPEIEPDIEPEDDQEPEIEIDPKLDQ